MKVWFSFTATRVAFLVILNVTVSKAAFADMAQQWLFDVYLDDQPIGEHRFQIEAHGAERQLLSQARFEVRFLFLTAYAYRHQATERWSGNCLTAVSAATDDNGTDYAVRGNLRGDRFIVSMSGNQSNLTPCVLSFAYWNPAILQQSRLLNVQTGNYQEIAVRYLGTEPIDVNDQPVLAERYVLATDDLTISLWYGQADRIWLALESETGDGYTLRYRLRDYQPGSTDGISR